MHNGWSAAWSPSKQGAKDAVSSGHGGHQGRGPAGREAAAVTYSGRANRMSSATLTSVGRRM
jgi:hypothetical protein